jgi:hypothetical protein
VLDSAAMRTRWWLPLCSLFLCCGKDPTVVVAKVGQEAMGTATFECTSDPFIGPNGYQWCTYSVGGGTSDWTDQQRLAFTAHSPKDIRAGVAFQFDSIGTFQDLSSFSQVALDLDVTEGKTFELFLGQGPNTGCSYVFENVSPGAQTYKKDLGMANWCMPSQCGFDLQASGGMLLAHVPTDSVLSAAVTGVQFDNGESLDGGTVASGHAAGSAQAYNAAVGPGGFCWFRIAWNGANIVDASPPSSSSVSVCAIATDDNNDVTSEQVGGLAFELPTGFDLAQYTYLDVTAGVYVSAPPSSTGTGGAGAGGAGAGGAMGTSGATGTTDSLSACNVPAPCGRQLDGSVPEGCNGIGGLFKIQGVNENRGMYWKFDAKGEPGDQKGQSVYRLYLPAPDGYFGETDPNKRLKLGDVLRFEIIVEGGEPGTLNATITDVKFVK